MWTEENVQAVVNKACTEIDRLLTPAGGRGRGSDDFSHVEESDDMAEFMRVESVDGLGGRLDSPCFRLGAGEVRLHRPQRKSGGVGGIITVRQQGGGGRFKCFAACCNQPLDQGCIHCDQIIATLPSSSLSKEEVHFLNPAMRDSEVFSLNGKANQLARMLCMSFVGGRLYERYRHRHQQRRSSSSSGSSTAIPVNLHRELAMRFGKSPKLRDLSLLEELKNCVEDLTDVVTRQRKETADRKRLWQEGGDSDDNNYRKRFKQCLSRQRNLDAVDAARLRAKQGEEDSGGGGDEGALWTAIRLYMPDRWEDGGFARHYDYTMDLDGRLESEIKHLREANLKEASDALWKWGNTKAGGGPGGEAGEADQKEEARTNKEATQQKVEELCREIGVPQLQRRIEVVVQKAGNGGAVVRFNVHSYDR